MSKRTEPVQPQNKPCPARQANARKLDFDCRMLGSHGLHVDSRTGTRWGEGKWPRGWNRRWAKTYSNRKLRRQSLAGRAR